MDIKTYHCPITDYELYFIIEEQNNLVILENVLCDYQYPRALALLFRSAHDDFQKMKITSVAQIVTVEDYENFLQNKTSWRIVWTKDDLCKIICDLDDFLENFFIGTGII